MVLPYSNSNYGADENSAQTASNTVDITANTAAIATKADLNGDTAQRFSAKELTVKHPSSAQGVNVREGVNSGFTNVVLEITDPNAELNESVDFYANLAVREVYVYNPTTSDPQGSAISALIDNAQGDAENALTLAETNETAIATLTASLATKADVTVDSTTGANMIETNEVHAKEFVVRASADYQGNIQLLPESLGVGIEEFLNSGLTNAAVTFRDKNQVAASASDNYANVVTRDVYVGGGISTTSLKSVLTTLNDLTASGTVAQMKYHQTRARKEDANGNHVGYLVFTAGDSTINDVHIDLMDITITPKAAGNAILCQWNINYNITGDQGDCIFIVKRNDGTTSTTLPFAEDSSGAYWTGVSFQSEHSNTHRGSNLDIKIVDESCLATTTTYELYVRVTDLDGATTNFYLNHPPPPNVIGDITNNTNTHEGTLSLATLTEIRA